MQPMPMLSCASVSASSEWYQRALGLVSLCFQAVQGPPQLGVPERVRSAVDYQGWNPQFFCLATHIGDQLGIGLGNLVHDLAQVLVKLVSRFAAENHIAVSLGRIVAVCEVDNPARRGTRKAFAELSIED